MPYDLTRMQQEVLLALVRNDDVQLESGRALTLYLELGTAGLVDVEEFPGGGYLVTLTKTGHQVAAELRYERKGWALEPSSSIPGPEEMERARQARRGEP